MQTKDELRRSMTSLRNDLGSDQRKHIDARIAERVESLPAYTEAPSVFTYLSFSTEIDTRAIINHAWEHGKKVFIPRCIEGSREMAWHEITSFESLVPGSFGIDEPAADDNTRFDPAEADEHAIALVPALSIDPRGYRLGYGGGYYDRFLPTFPGIAVGLCRDVQMSSTPLPAEENDIPVSIVVTESSAAQCA